MKAPKITQSKFSYVDFLSTFHIMVRAAENGSAAAERFLTTTYHSFKITQRVLALPDPSYAPRQADPHTPSAETLQAWFDLPSEPRQAEGSPSES